MPRASAISDQLGPQPGYQNSSTQAHRRQICSLLQRDRPVIRAYRLTSDELPARPASLQPVRNNPHFLAHHHRDGQNDRYDLVIVEDDGSEHRMMVKVIEQDIVVVG